MTQPSPTALPAAALAPVQEKTPKWWFLLPLGILLATLLPFVLMLAPGMLGLPKYEVAGGQIVARSLASRTVISKGTPVEKTSVGLIRKIYGSNMAGYTVGRFDSLRGEVALYSNGSSPRAGLLFSTQPPTFITPADPNALLRAWNSGATSTFRPAPVPTRENLWVLLLMLPALGIVGALFVVKPHITYRAEGDTLTVKSRASTTVFPRCGTKASLTTDHLGMRLFGTAMPGYYTGTFSTGGGNVQVAATTAKPVQALLLEHAGKRYYLTPSDPEAVAAWFGEH